jgi:hypothetical protein
MHFMSSVSECCTVDAGALWHANECGQLTHFAAKRLIKKQRVQAELELRAAHEQLQAAEAELARAEPKLDAVAAAAAGGSAVDVGEGAALHPELDLARDQVWYDGSLHVCAHLLRVSE